jgi:peptidoglycan lytic transglycosylase
VEPNNDLHVRLARLRRHVLSPRSAHAPTAFVRLAPLAVLTMALAIVAGILHGAAGAHAMPAPLTPTQTASALEPAQSAPVRVHIRIARSSLNVLEGHPVGVLGGLHPALAHQRVLLQERRGGRWHTVAHTHTGRRGRFQAHYVPRRLTTVALRVATSTATRRVGLLKVYHQAYASWYGGGGSLACGGELTSSTLGVASRTLPCGTLVTLRYGDRSVRVPVVDRGPYVPGREFDLTEATKQALGFPDLGDVWSSR